MTPEHILATCGSKAGLSKSLNRLHERTIFEFEEIGEIPNLSETRVKELVSMGLAETGNNTYGKFGYRITDLGCEVRKLLKDAKNNRSKPRLKTIPPRLKPTPPH